MNQLLVLLLIGCLPQPAPFNSTSDAPSIQSPHSDSSDPGIYSHAIWFLQTHGHPACSKAKNDRRIKAVLAKSLTKDKQLAWEEVSEWIPQDVFNKFAGRDKFISETELTEAVKLTIPQSRKALHPKLREHAELLTTSFDLISPEHYAAMDQLSEWIAKHWTADTTLHVISTCTGNSRRSILGATMGNLAAAHYGFDNIRFHSGGTIPSAFNHRTIATLKEIGFEIAPTGEEAEREDPKVPNPKYRVVWGSSLEAIEFSKNYKDDSNPQSGFAAILVCNEADAECPIVPGASIRISMTFLDPKSFDDGKYESRKYAERRDDIGRTLLAVMADARRKVFQDRETK